jgi:hypothetical protein
VVQLSNARAKVQVVDGWLADSWDLWCQGTTGVVVAGRGIGYVVEVVVEVGGEFGCMTEVLVWIGVGLMLHLVEWRFLPLLLLVSDFDGVLYLCEPCSLSVDVLPLGFGVLGCHLPTHDGFLFLVEPLNLLLDSEQLLLINSFIFRGFFFVNSLVVGLARARCLLG